jgi:hypothetical protein
LINFGSYCESTRLITIRESIFIWNNTAHNWIALFVTEMTFARRSRTPLWLIHFFRIRICEINLTLISLMIHLSAMTYWLMMLGIELLERFHLAKVEVITFFVETIQFFWWLIINNSFALLCRSWIQIRHIPIFW